MSETSVTVHTNGGTPAPSSAQLAMDGGALLAMIERAARDPATDIDKMERLFHMHERVMARSAETAFNTAMAAAQAELKPVVRTLTNKQTNSKYADLAAISDAVDPIIHKHGFGVIASEFRSDLEHHVGVRCEITHAAGHSKSYDFHVPTDGAGIKGNANKTPTHAYASTITYGRRYAKCAVFDVATKNDTDGNAATATITDEQAETIKLALEATGGLLPKFCAYYRLEKLTDLPASKFAGAMQAIETSGRKRKEASNG